MAMNEQNLKPFKKGISGNPGGRPKGSRNLSTILEDVLNRKVSLEDPILKKEVKSRIGEIIVLKLTQKALEGDLRAINEIFDRAEGRPLCRQEVKHDGGEEHREFFLDILRKLKLDRKEDET